MGRRSARLSMIIPITIHGTDNGGQAFRENTWTIGVNKQGAKIATFHPLLLGSQISVVNPVLGRTAKARVIWVGEKRFPEDPYEVGVELVEAQNVWGVKFPPEDWQRPLGAGGGVRGHEGAAEGAEQAAAKSVPPEAPKSPEGAEPAATPKESAAPPEKFNQFNLAMTALSHFAQQAGVTAGERSEALPGPPAKPVDSEVRAMLQQVRDLQEKLQEKENYLRSFEERLKSEADRLQASRDQVEALLAKFEGARQAQAEVKQGRSISEGSAPSIESALEMSGQQLVERLTQSFDEHAQAAFQISERAFQEKLEKLETQVQEQTSGAGLRIQQECEQAAEEFRKIVSNRVDWAVDSLNIATGAAAAKLLAAYQKVEADSEAFSADYPRKLGELSSFSLEAFRLKTQTLLADFQASMEKTWTEFQERGTKEITERLGENSDELLESWAKQLHRQADDVLEMLTEQLKALGAQLVNETKKQLLATSHSTRQTLASEAEGNVQTVRALGEKLGAAGEALVGEAAKQLSVMTRATLESLAREAQTVAEECQSQAQGTLQEFRDRGPRELEADLQRVLEKHREAMLKELQKQAEDSTERALAQIRSRSDVVAKEASETVYKQVGVGAVVLKDWADQARAQLENFLQRSAEVFQKQISVISETTLEKHHKGAEAMVQDLRARLQQAASIFREKEPEPTETESKEAPVEQTVAASPPPDSATGENLDPAIERFKKRQEQAIKEAAEAFRNRLTEMLAGFQTDAEKTDEQDR